MNNIGEVIGIWIKKKGFTQKGFAEKIGKSETALSQIVTGKYNPNPKTLKRICQELKIEIKYYVKNNE